jgi:serine/threonine-protein kinase RsbW
VISPMRRELFIPCARYRDLAAVRRFVSVACGDAHASAAVRDALELAVDEACTNVMEHGYPGDKPGPITIVFECDGDEVRVRIVDHGKPFSPDLAPRPDTLSGWNRRHPGGLGWHLIRSVVDRLHYDIGADGTNRLTLAMRPASTNAETGKTT